MNNYVYILKLSDGTYYTGYTLNLKKRLTLHNEGKGAKRTRGRKAKLVCYQTVSDKSSALSLEAKIKSLSREKKEDLIKKIRLTILDEP